MADPLLSFRGEFPILSSTKYLISNSLGAMPRAAEGALAEYAQAWATRGVDYRPGVGIRLAPHFYTEDAELDRAFGVIDEIRAGSAGRRRRSRPSLVT